MNSSKPSRRDFLRTTGLAAGACLFSPRFPPPVLAIVHQPPGDSPDYTLHIKTSAFEIAPKRIVSAVTYNGQFPGPLLRLKEGRRIVVDVVNDTDTPEQLHWHGQFVPVDVDGAAEEGTPFIPAHGMRRISFVPRPSGFRFYHTHVVPMNNLGLGTYTGQAGPVYIEPVNNPGDYDREVFLVLKEFLPSFSQGGKFRPACWTTRCTYSCVATGNVFSDAARLSTM